MVRGAGDNDGSLVLMRAVSKPPARRGPPSASLGPAMTLRVEPRTAVAWHEARWPRWQLAQSLGVAPQPLTWGPPSARAVGAADRAITSRTMAGSSAGTISQSFRNLSPPFA